MHGEHIMIDGYNMIFRVPGLRDLGHSDLERARTELVRRMSEAFRGRRERITIVFDGNRDIAAHHQPGAGSVRVAFSSPPETADQRIQRLVEDTHSTSGRGDGRLPLRVVSSDREVAGRARLWGAVSTSVEDFLREIEGRRRATGQAQSAGKRSEALSEREVEMWEDLFRSRRRLAEDQAIDDREDKDQRR